MKHCVLKRLEAGLLVMMTVLFLYAPAAVEPENGKSPELRCRTFELVQELAEWFETTFSHNS